MKGSWLLAGFLLLAVAAGWGCASADPANRSARPWNTPKQWETGLPSAILEGR
ncbi:hypothetical protein [Limisphaera sp. VF-2]|jgi:hypothetical protein|uniref:hypothetical protein n=1 Tax=Limisphaera sp. VF-2 TaxID=3400418 RepID=UPI00256611C6|nr:hypothetical protein [Limisphaera sp.]